MILRWSFIFLAFLLPLSAQAEIFAEGSGISESNYFGISLLGLNYSEEDFDVSETGASVRLGHEFSNYFALEGHVVAGLEDDSSLGLEISIDYLAGIYLRGNIFLWDPRARLYGLVGVTTGKVSAEAFGLSDTLTDTELGYGLGFEFYADDRNAVNLEFMRYMDGEDSGFDYEIEAFSLGYTHRF
jgi:hypothetical protein